MPETHFRTPAGELPGHLATPVTPGPWPGVVVIHEVFGMNDDIRQSADRLAAAGYLTLAPDLYGWGSTPRCLQATFRSLLSGHGRAYDDIEGARQALARRDDCTGRVGVIGFCMGGGFALLAATRGFDAAAPCYGPLPKDLEARLAGACPVVASYGGRDRGLRGAAGRLQRGLEAAGVEHDVREYPDAGHSFLNRHDLGPFRVLERVAGLGYHHRSAEDAWRRILTFFGTHLEESRAGDRA